MSDHGSTSLDLSGSWAFELDPNDVGITQGWFQRRLSHTLNLPGSLQAQGFGEEITVDTVWTGDIVDRSWFEDDGYARFRQPGNIKIPFWLQPERHYQGPAWYQRTVEIPSEWQGKRVTLALERPHWETRVWVDGEAVGSCISLSTPHVYDLGMHLTAGSHTLTLRVDNRMLINVGPNSHSMTDHTQTNWNGVVGQISLSATAPAWIGEVQVFPDLAHKRANLQIHLHNALHSPLVGTLTLLAGSEAQPGLPAQEVKVHVYPGESLVEVNYPLGPQFVLWDEFNPALYHLSIELNVSSTHDALAGPLQAHRQLTFGLRELSVIGTQLALNGRPIFLRGTLESCIFPLTGYPPVDVDSWKKIIHTCQEHGLNHIRFHSYCPPEAAFSAADELGFYYQVEIASWANQGASIGTGEALDQWLYDEANRIIAAYGNHPSFLLMAYGNEPGGDMVGYLSRWVSYWKQHEPRRFHTSGAGWPIIPENDYHSTFAPRLQLWGAELNSRINALPPETVTDYRSFVADLDRPIISHEIGQWCVYPSFAEIEKYTGYLKAKNYELFRETLEDNHMGHQAQDFLIASGKLQTLCYKEDIESALRTPGFAGFQLLDLHDFPGQGTALVGVLDAFWEQKGYVTPAEYHRFCSATVPLARLPRRIWHTGETFSAQVEVAHFGERPLENAVLYWQVKDPAGGSVVYGSTLAPQTIQVGNNNPAVQVTLSLQSLAPGRKYQFVLGIEGTEFENDWDFWVFAQELPGRPEADDSAAIYITRSLDDAALAQLGKGRKVLLLAAPGGESVSAGQAQVQVDSVIGFSSVFWNTAWTRGQAPHTLGILCDPAHPVFAHFPTESHSNWQWWELVHAAAAMTLDRLGVGANRPQPLVQPIDTWFENRCLALLFEARVAGGRLMVCSMDLSSDLEKRLVARQMRHSLLSYMDSAAFDPAVSLEPAAVLNLFKPTASQTPA